MGLQVVQPCHQVRGEHRRGRSILQSILQSILTCFLILVPCRYHGVDFAEYGRTLVQDIFNGLKCLYMPLVGQVAQIESTNKPRPKANDHLP